MIFFDSDNFQIYGNPGAFSITTERSPLFHDTEIGVCVCVCVPASTMEWMQHMDGSMDDVCVYVS